ncbi:hypothetical protein [Prosthecobacter sp.]|uniref:hypothetical protein n=1 Tax=Prosthecobacter sp. TaxID=1965333 RepID=UPI0037832E60
MKAKSSPADTPPAVNAPPLPRQLGANHSDTARRPRKHHNNFKQSNDLREDRGIRQLKASPKAQSNRGGR